MTDGGPPPELPHEHRVFVELVHDVLRSAPGLEHHLALTEAGLSGADPSAYAVFLVETNPDHDLTVAIELADREIRIIVNGRRFARRRSRTQTVERWIDRSCRLVERLVAPDLRLEEDTFVGAAVASRLQTRTRRRWRTLLTVENGWAGVVTMLVPWGFAFSKTREISWSSWYRRTDGTDEPSPAEDAEEPPAA